MEQLLEEFERLYNYQSAIGMLLNKQLDSKYTAAEIHCVDTVGNSQTANGKQLSQKLGLTKGAVSKLTHRLEREGLLESFRIEGNKKEKHFRLTESGWELYQQHKQAHQAWIERDKRFLQTVSEQDRKTVLSFLVSFNEYLKNLMEEKSDEQKNF